MLYPNINYYQFIFSMRKVAYIATLSCCNTISNPLNREVCKWPHMFAFPVDVLSVSTNVDSYVHSCSIDQNVYVHVQNVAYGQNPQLPRWTVLVISARCPHFWTNHWGSFTWTAPTWRLLGTSGKTWSWPQSCAFNMEATRGRLFSYVLLHLQMLLGNLWETSNRQRTHKQPNQLTQLNQPIFSYFPLPVFLKNRRVSKPETPNRAGRGALGLARAVEQEAGLAPGAQPIPWEWGDRSRWGEDGILIMVWYCRNLGTSLNVLTCTAWWW